MSDYRTVNLTGSYRERQLKANALGVICYAEQHLNALEVDKPGVKDNPALAIVTTGARAKTLAWASSYSRTVSEAFKVPNLGAQRRGPTERGYYNLAYTKAPAVLLEPLFVSEPEHVEFVTSPEGQALLAGILMASIREAFPEGGLVGLSRGHLGARPGDLGAPLRVGGKVVAWEANLADAILRKVEAEWPAK